MQLQPLIRLQLVALHSACMAMVYAIDQILALEQQSEFQRKESPRAESEKKEGAEPESDRCTHPLIARHPMPSMGKSNRFHCRACNEVVDE